MLFGHSSGALVAFEVARWLRSEGVGTLLRLLVSGRRAPHIPDDGAPTCGMTDEEFVEHLRVLGGTPHEVLANPEILRLVAPRLRADFTLVEC